MTNIILEAEIRFNASRRFQVAWLGFQSQCQVGWLWFQSQCKNLILFQEKAAHPLEFRDEWAMTRCWPVISMASRSIHHNFKTVKIHLPRTLSAQKCINNQRTSHLAHSKTLIRRYLSVRFESSFHIMIKVKEVAWFVLRFSKLKKSLPTHPILPHKKWVNKTNNHKRTKTYPNSGNQLHPWSSFHSQWLLSFSWSTSHPK